MSAKANAARVAEVMSIFTGLDEGRVRRVLRALPALLPSEVAALAQDDALFSQVAKGNLSALTKARLYRDHKETQGQGSLPGLGGGGLFG